MRRVSAKDKGADNGAHAPQAYDSANSASSSSSSTQSLASTSRRDSCDHGERETPVSSARRHSSTRTLAIFRYARIRRSEAINT
ncbi:hypothetical protein MRX96_013070 [Rhipicephalus microplus]